MISWGIFWRKKSQTTGKSNCFISPFICYDLVMRAHFWGNSPSFKMLLWEFLVFFQVCNTILCTTDQVSWIRGSDLHILTVGETSYTNNLKFFPTHPPGSDEWNLRCLAFNPYHTNILYMAIPSGSSGLF